LKIDSKYRSEKRKKETGFVDLFWKPEDAELLVLIEIKNQNWIFRL
jgi:hypothetical protein